VLTDERGRFGRFSNKWHLKGQKNNQHLSLSKEIKFQKNSTILMKKCHAGGKNPLHQKFTFGTSRLQKLPKSCYVFTGHFVEFYQLTSSKIT
jgi:hypothetical protein